MHAVFVGEAMLELSQVDGAWQLGYGGDVLNTALHMARMGADARLLTALGTDSFSQSLRAQWDAEGLDTRLILAHPVRKPGLYAIATDAAGERSFSYWRSESAAREMFNCPGAAKALAQAERADLLVFSLITLAILPEDGRRQLLSLARQVRKNGGEVAFDGNYRPLLWRSPAEARTARDAAILCATIGLPTLEDEQLLGGTQDAQEVAAHWQKLGCTTTIVKLGVAGCRLPDGTVIAPEKPLDPVDTSGAGDAFNAGFLAARLKGLELGNAATIGHRVAGLTIMRKGAIPQIDPADYPHL